MTKENFKVLACDLDGTLFFPKQRKRFVSKKNTAFLRKFIDSGNRVLLVSSRSEDFIKKVIAEIDRPIDYIAVTGAIISANNELIRYETINNEELKTVLDEITKKYNPLGFSLTTSQFANAVKSTQKISGSLLIFYKIWYKWFFGIYQESFVVSNELTDKEIKQGEVYGARLFFGIKLKKNKINKEINKELRENHPEIEASWIGMVIEISPRDCSKATALEIYAEHQHIAKEDIYVIGDSGNDISMFIKFHENSFVMMHAFPSVKKYAKHEVSRVYKLDKYVFGKEKNYE